ncbi:hypothetical protein HBI24_222980 [Parastagonospora nodorum]|nr:hypothetical protein HBH42_224610 [Parastagonospora nodorum]KAH4188802.1 hypothetical protein HBI95_226960 [Parastagonospora nodorum]KAH4892416.1 hypothetical protein HBH74_209580 [Parastagonospora nodorum]KAH4923725.1 hypothetical protein HBH73_211840 [Parastagonospora nodorum]KAH5090592.1 hypothetical protein HBH72_215930 [Parastagonospora nodorum]
MPPKRKLVVVPQLVINKKMRQNNTANRRPAVKVTQYTMPKAPSGILRPIRKVIAPEQPSPPDSPMSSLRSQSFPSTVIVKPSGRYELDRYPWDDYQDSIVVNSIEDDYGSPDEFADDLTGVKHYLHMLNQRPYTRICTDFDEYRWHGTSRPNHTHDYAYHEMAADDDTYTSLPLQVPDYTNPIYTATTSNPAVFLAITFIACHNLAFLDLTSALNHIPNHPPSFSAPISLKNIARTAYTPRATDLSLTLLFAPKFYPDDTHAIGFYGVSGACLFTPCSTAQLEKFGMIDWAHKAGDGKRSHVRAVGCRGGRWLKSETVEDWEEWKRSVNRVGKGWGKRVREFMGQ